MREQTKRMLRLLHKEQSVTDMQANDAGVINPRREAGLLIRREGQKINIHKHSYSKREYQLINS